VIVLWCSIPKSFPLLCKLTSTLVPPSIESTLRAVTFPRPFEARYPPSSRSNALASFRSAVSKPSVNHPYTSTSIERASVC
jgi:hypothetical protein